jgi:hypothetical protein
MPGPGGPNPDRPWCGCWMAEWACRWLHRRKRDAWIGARVFRLTPDRW